MNIDASDYHSIEREGSSTNESEPSTLRVKGAPNFRVFITYIPDGTDCPYLFTIMLKGEKKNYYVVSRRVARVLKGGRLDCFKLFDPQDQKDSKRKTK